MNALKEKRHIFTTEKVVRQRSSSSDNALDYTQITLKDGKVRQQKFNSQQYNNKDKIMGKDQEIPMDL